MSRENIEKLKSLIDYELLLGVLGFDIKFKNSEELRGPCKIHGGDNSTAFCLKKSSGRFYCYTHQCENDSSGSVDNDVVSLIMRIKGYSFIESVKFLSDLTGFDALGFSNNHESEFKREYNKQRFVERTKKQEEEDTQISISEDLVKKFREKGCPYFQSKGIDKTIINVFELGTYTDFFGVERASIPIRDESGNLVSISGRRVDGDDEPRYRLVKNFKRSKVLYNLNNTLDFLDIYNQTLIIVEGFKALWAVYSSGFPNCVAAMGSRLSSSQVNLMIKRGILNCILMLDGDKAGRKGMSSSEEMLKGKLNFKSIYLTENTSPDDYNFKDLGNIINSVYVKF